jgi:hypothetical protein
MPTRARRLPANGQKLPARSPNSKEEAGFAVHLSSNRGLGFLTKRTNFLSTKTQRPSAITLPSFGSMLALVDLERLRSYGE